MKERPILFSGPMVRAILTCAKCGHLSVAFPCEKCGSTEFRKTQTRRVVKVPKWCGSFRSTGEIIEPVIEEHADGPMTICADTGCLALIPCPYGVPGDRLWVREASIISPVGFCGRTEAEWTHEDDDGNVRIVQYLATSPNRDAANNYKLKATPSIHMPRWASRITLEITEVRVQRVQEIGEEDARAEGAKSADYATGRECILDSAKGSYRLHFRDLWDSINAKRGFGFVVNPWVWALTFGRVGDG